MQGSLPYSPSFLPLSIANRFPNISFCISISYPTSQSPLSPAFKASWMNNEVTCDKDIHPTQPLETPMPAPRIQTAPTGATSSFRFLDLQSEFRDDVYQYNLHARRQRPQDFASMPKESKYWLRAHQACSTSNVKSKKKRPTSSITKTSSPLAQQTTRICCDSSPIIRWYLWLAGQKDNENFCVRMPISITYHELLAGDLGALTVHRPDLRYQSVGGALDIISLSLADRGLWQILGLACWIPWDPH